MNTVSINKLLLNQLHEFVDLNEIVYEGPLTTNTRLLGSDSIFDSMDLVSFIVECEQVINENFDINIELTTDKAMSRRTSPFLNIESLSKFIIELTNE